MTPARRQNLFIIVGFCVAYAFIMRIGFGYHGFRHLIWVMSIAFLVSLPFGVGVLAIALSPIEWVKSLRYRIFFPWVPIFIFFLLSLWLVLEGWACWLMILPIFLGLSSLGGLVAGHFKLKKWRNENKLNASLVCLLPFVLAAFEHLLPALPTRYEAYTYTDIHSSRDQIWNNVLRVRAIPASSDKATITRWLGFPRPVKAELNYAGVGASRKAIFTGGLVFDEVVKEYEPGKRMYFSIRANPHDIPATTMDEHVVIGGDYFDVLDGTYRLEPLNDSTWRLHLYSHFELTTNFNFYASWWAGWIMRDIQDNILQVIKTRCEGTRE
jgi:hypothetical protein